MALWYRDTLFRQLSFFAQQEGGWGRYYLTGFPIHTRNSKTSLLWTHIGPHKVFADGVRCGPGFIYLLSEQSKTDGQTTCHYKIGVTSNPAKRVADLQTWNPRPLYLQGEPKHVSRVLSAERSIHKAVGKYASKLGGGQEWFYVPQQDWKHFWECYQKAIKPYLCIEKPKRMN